METQDFPYSQYARPGSKSVKFAEDKFKNISARNKQEPLISQNDKENSSNFNFGGSQSKFPSLKGTKKTSPTSSSHLVKQINAVESHKFGGAARKTVKKSDDFQKSGAIASFASRFSSSSTSNGRESSAKLSDLCPKDKAKIGELVKTVAKGKKENSELKQASRRKEEMYRRQIREISEDKMRMERSIDELKQKFSESLRMLNSLREHNEELTNSVAQYSSIQSTFQQSSAQPTTINLTNYPVPQQSTSPPRSVEEKNVESPLYKGKLISKGTPALELIRQMQSSTESLESKKYESTESNQTLEEIAKLKQHILSIQRNIKNNAPFMNVAGESASQSRISDEQESGRKDYSPTPQKIQKITVKTKKVFEEDEMNQRVQETDESDLEDRRLEEEWRAKRQGRSMEKTKKQGSQIEKMNMIKKEEERTESKDVLTREDLAHFKQEMLSQINMVSSMIQSKLGASPSFAEQSELTLGRVTYEAKEGSPTKGKLYLQREEEEAESPAPEPRAPPQREEQRFEKKMEIYEQIKQRVSTQDSLTTPPTPEISNKFSSLMKSAAKSSSEIREKRKLERSAKEQFLGTNMLSQRTHHSPVEFSYSMSGQFKQSMMKHMHPSPDSIPTHDYDQNLASELNSGGGTRFISSQTPGTLRSQNPKLYDDSLFNLIDQIESQGGDGSHASPGIGSQLSELPLQASHSDLIMSRSGVIKVRPKENPTPQSVSQFKVKNANILVEQKQPVPSSLTGRAPTRAQVGNQFSFALKTPLSVDRARVEKLYAEEAKQIELQNQVRPFEENSESSDSSLCEGESIPQRDQGYQPHFLKGTVASTMKAMANSKYKTGSSSFSRKQPTARRLSFNSKKERFMNKLKGLNYNYEDVPEQDEYDSSLEEP